MDSHLRAYVWGQVFAAKLSIHGFTVSDAAIEADAALAEFDKRNFNSDVEGDIANLSGQLEVVNKAQQLDQINEIVGQLALPNETTPETVARILVAHNALVDAHDVIAPAPVV